MSEMTPLQAQAELYRLAQATALLRLTLSGKKIPQQLKPSQEDFDKVQKDNPELVELAERAYKSN